MCHAVAVKTAENKLFIKRSGLLKHHQVYHNRLSIPPSADVPTNDVTIHLFPGGVVELAEEQKVLATEKIGQYWKWRQASFVFFGWFRFRDA